jgi:UDP-glucuronate decarboxylase
MKSKIINEDITKIYKEYNEDLSKLIGKTILITGANGFLASYLVDAIAQQNSKLILLNKNPIDENSRLFHLKDKKNVKFITQDVGKPFIIDEKADIVIHAASNSTVSSSVENPLDTIDANVIGLRTLLEYSKQNKVEEFLFFSSADVYGNPDQNSIPTSEEYPGNVICTSIKACYAESKRLGETLCMDFYRNYNTPIKILRIFNTYGPGLRNDGKTISRFFKEALSLKKINVYGNGEARRSFSYITDTIGGILYVLFRGKSGEMYNIGNDTNNVTIIQLAKMIGESLDKNILINIENSKPELLKYGINNLHPNISKLRKLGFNPEISLEKGLVRTGKWYNERICPICEKENENTIKYNMNYNLKDLKEDFFSARRERKKTKYEHNTFRICKKCSLIYSSPILNPELIEKLYKKSKFTYDLETENLKKSYGACLKMAEKFVGEKGKLLDIGGGNGFFMEEALTQGYKEVFGVEPSKHAVDLANKDIKKNIKIDILRENQFRPNFFDVICFFHVLDHIIDPNKFLKSCFKYLKNGGIIICITHNVEASSAKIMGERSPIFDIEHTQLFSKKTINSIFTKNNFKTLKIFDVINTYTLGYWLNAAPLPHLIKYPLKNFFQLTGFINKQITIKPGNVGIIAQK